MRSDLCVAVLGCPEPVKARGHCSKHYDQRLRKRRWKGFSSPEKLMRSRARNRATQVLIEQYAEDFKALYEYFLLAVYEEQSTLAEQAEARGFDINDFRLKTGPRLPGESDEDRLIPIYRCLDCLEYHSLDHDHAKQAV